MSFDPVALISLVIGASIVLIVAGLGMHADWADAFFLFHHPLQLTRSFIAMNVAMPLIAAGFVVVFDPPLAVAVALVAISISPVPPLIPKKELKAGAFASYAIGLFFATALLSIVTVPVSVLVFSYAFEREASIAPIAVLKVVLKTVLIPLAAGIIVRLWLPNVAGKLARPAARLGMALLILGVLPLAYSVWPAIRALIGNGTILIICALATIGLALGHMLGGPRADDRTVLALSTTSRHPAVALAAAVAAGVQLKPALAAIAMYVIVAALISVPYVAWRKRLSHADQPELRSG